MSEELGVFSDISKEEMKTFLEGRVWKALEQLAQIQVGHRYNSVFQPLEGDKDAMAQLLSKEFLKGEAAGIKVIIATPIAILEAMQADTGHEGTEDTGEHDVEI
jgi:hypothetical protein